MNLINIHNADALTQLKATPTASIDAIITDPPYEIGWDTWDSSGIAYSVELWAEALRVLKPGAAAAVFGSSRTFFLVASAMSEAGFHIQDSMAWIYPRGQVKQPDLSYRMEAEGVEDGRVTAAILFARWLSEVCAANNITAKDYSEKLQKDNMFGHYMGKSQPMMPTPERWQDLREKLLEPAGISVPEEIETLLKERGTHRAAQAARLANRPEVPGSKPKTTRAYTSEGKKWEGWRDKMSPQFEPIIIARKPVAWLSELPQNAAEAPGWGTKQRATLAANAVAFGVTAAFNHKAVEVSPGKLTGNVAIDGTLADYVEETTGRAAAFFFASKPSKAERPKTASGVAHSTVKPLSLMRHLVGLLCPPGGVVLDFFAGSGTTLEAAALEGRESIGVEQNAEYIELIEIRKKRVEEKTEEEQ